MYDQTDKGSADYEALAHRLQSGASESGISLSSHQTKQLMDYLLLLNKWNKAYNLTSIRKVQDMVALHLLDSMVIHPYIQGVKRLLDVGTGPGLPGMVLAIMNPETPITLLDSNGKKTRFLFQACTALKLDNVTIVNERVEAYQPSELFDIIVSRAFASLLDMTHWCRHALADDGCFLAMKGQYPEKELSDIAHQYVLTQKDVLTVPGVDGERHLLRIKPV